MLLIFSAALYWGRGWLRVLYFHCAATYLISSLTPSNCPILDNKELHEAHPWFEFLVQCRGVASNPGGRRLPLLQRCPRVSAAS